jgi:hypothetical protein
VLIGQVYLKNGVVVLRDVDGSEENLLLEEALELADWINQHRAEIEYRIEELNASTLNMRNRPSKTFLKPDARPREAEAHSANSRWKHLEQEQE